MRPKDDALEVFAPAEWCVCFCKTEASHPFDWLMRPGFRHVFLLGHVKAIDLWLLYDVRQDVSSVGVVSREMAGAMLELALDEGAVLKFVPRAESAARLWWRFGFWCTRAVAHVLGVRCVAVSPLQLHDFLLRHGAIPLRRTI